MTKLHGQCFIGGRLCGTEGKGVKVTSPLDQKKLAPEVAQATQAEVNAAAEAAEAAFPTYAALDSGERSRFLEAIATRIEGLGDALIARAHAETGLPAERLAGERARTCAQLRLFASVVREGSWVDARIDTALPDRKPLPRPDLRRMLVPLGPVAVFGSSNFPLAFSVAGGDTASALAAGCPVVVKAHSAHPGTAELVATAVADAVASCGLPGGVFSMLHGSGREIGAAIACHPRIKAIGFTGSHLAGRALFNAASARPEPIPVFAEMSSLNPVFLLPGALTARGAQIAEGLKGSLTLGVGQFCTKPGLIFAVKGSPLDEFKQILGQAISTVPPQTMLHAGIRDSFHEGSQKLANLPGVQILARAATEADAARTEGALLVVETDAETFLKHPALAEEEVFGPFGVVVAGDSFDALEAIAHGLSGQLTVTLHGIETDLQQAQNLISILRRKAGRMVFNGFPTGVEVCAAMTHGGPYPATTDARFTSVGTAAMLRFARPVTWQNFPAPLLPAELLDANPREILRLVNAVWKRDPEA